MALTIFTSARFTDHRNPPGHPERVERAEVMQVVASEFRRRGGSVVEPKPATDEQIARVHDREYIGMIRETAGRAVALDPDTFTSPESYEVARLSAGGVVGAVEHVLEGAPRARALVMSRPPGHHAERNRAMGFCLFNNAAIGAAHARARGLSRVAVVDYDVHHGNGTQRTFYSDASVLFVSSHQFPFYPGTGDSDEIGTGPGAGTTINFPLAAGATDADYERVYVTIASILRQFRPQLILVSAGFDAHADDPLGGMRVTAPEFGRISAHIAAIADECCEGRLVAVTEGGYDLPALASSLRAAIQVLHEPTALETLPVPAGSTPRADASIAAARTHLGKFWTI